MGLARFRVVVEPGEPATIEVNGRELPEGLAVRELSLTFDANSVPRLSLVVAGEGCIEGEGIVVVQPEGEAADLRQLVAGLDPEEWDRAAMNLPAGLDTSTGHLYKAALMGMLP